MKPVSLLGSEFYWIEIDSRNYLNTIIRKNVSSRIISECKIALRGLHDGINRPIKANI